MTTSIQHVFVVSAFNLNSATQRNEVDVSLAPFYVVVEEDVTQDVEQTEIEGAAADAARAQADTKYGADNWAAIELNEVGSGFEGIVIRK